METGSDRAKIEGATILREHSAALPAKSLGWYSWPEALQENWPRDIPLYARSNILLALVEVVLSKEQSWWHGGYEWMLAILDEALQHDPDEVIKNSAAFLLQALFRVHKTSVDVEVTGRMHAKSVRQIRERASQRDLSNADVLSDAYDLEQRIAEWGAMSSAPEAGAHD